MNAEERLVRNQMFIGTNIIHKACKNIEQRKWDEKMRSSIFYNLY
jgi:hypothetical protein